ncbi:MAG TPA: hypothetical protein VIQ02_07145, partial [Jiangellaceae bacterium]
MVGWHEGTFASARDQGVAEAGFQVVVEGAQRVEFVESGVAGLGPRDLVIPLHPPAVTALHRAGG